MTTRLEAAGTRAIRSFRVFFLVAAIYDIVLGAALFFFYQPVFDTLSIELPSNTSYIHLSAAYVFVQGLGYWFVYSNMLRNVDLVKLGVVYKAIYSAVAVYYLVIGQLLNAVFAWFAVFDVIFLIGFIRFLVLARPQNRYL